MTIREHLARALIEIVNAKNEMKQKYPENDPAASLVVTLYRKEIVGLQRQIERLLNTERVV